MASFTSTIRKFVGGAAAVLALLQLASASNVLQVEAAQCVASIPDVPIQITADCIDSNFSQPILTGEADETYPVPHRRVSGRFNGTIVDFNIYLPPKSDWNGRFFHLVYPLQTSTATDDHIAFSADSGAYFVQAAGARGYRGDAALAKFSRKVALEYYQESSRHIYGYVFGGSGGSMQTIGAMENTRGVWDGSVTFVQAVPMSNPNNWPPRALSGLILEGKEERIIETLSPGGSGNPFEVLDDTERAVLEETTALGVPLNAWEDFEGAGRNRTVLWESMKSVVSSVKARDPTYANDFWSKRGYLGTEDSKLGDIFRNALVDFNATIRKVITGEGNVPTAIVLDKIPAQITTRGLEFTIISDKGTSPTFAGTLELGSQMVYIQSNSNATILATLSKGTKLLVDNRWHLAVHTHHRHQVPPVSRGFYGYDYLRDKNGAPRYPQRDVLVSPLVSQSASGGGTHTGNITGKLIVMDSLLDYDAYPWHADWYKKQVAKTLGNASKDMYRLYFTDNADHAGIVPVVASETKRLVAYIGCVEQHLRDLSAWVEKGIIPPEPTKYTVENSQVKVPKTAGKRLGIQPVVDLSVDGGRRTRIAKGKKVKFEVKVEVPKGTGKVVSIEWDFDGTGEYVKLDFGKISSKVKVKISHTYDKRGTYLPAVRVASQREGDAKTSFGRVLNLARSRVTVT